MPHRLTVRSPLVVSVACVGLLLAGTLASPQTVLPTAYYPPTDEAVLEPELFATRAAVLMALQAKDWQALRRWMPDTPCDAYDLTCSEPERMRASDDRTAALMYLLNHGGKFTRPGRSTFCAPYWKDDYYRLSGFIYSRYDAMLSGAGKYWIVVVPDVMMRRGPSSDSPSLRRLTLEVLGVPKTGPPRSKPSGPEAHQYEWVGLGAQKGWVQRSAMRLMSARIQDSACFVQTQGRWRLAKISMDLVP